jgi:hypothetical protein
MDADYGRILDKDGKRIDQGEWENALFILTSIMSHAKADKAICDAGLKAQSVDSGLPFIFGRTDVEYVKCSDEHGVIADPERRSEGQRQAEARARPLRPDLQCPRLVCRGAGWQGRNRLARHRARLRLLGPNRKLPFQNILAEGSAGTPADFAPETTMSDAQDLIIVNEAIAQQVVSEDIAFTAIHDIFAAMAKGDAYNFPVIREAIGHADALYGFKSGFDRAGLALA